MNKKCCRVGICKQAGKQGNLPKNTVAGPAKNF